MTRILAENVASWIRDHFPESATVPIDLPRLATMLGVESITYTRLFEDGRLETDGTRARILVREDCAVARQRFTIAHELGHLLLTQPGQIAVERRLTTDNDVERFCDQFAAALLLPAEWVSETYADAPQTLTTVRQLSRATGTSLAASVVRLQQVLGWSRTLMHWRFIDGRWRFRWSAGAPAALHGRLRAQTATHEVFDSVRRRTTSDVSVHLPLQVHRKVMSFPAIVSCRGGSVLALIDHRPGHPGARPDLSE